MPPVHMIVPAGFEQWMDWEVLPLLGLPEVIDHEFYFQFAGWFPSHRAQVGGVSLDFKHARVSGTTAMPATSLGSLNTDRPYNRGERPRMSSEPQPCCEVLIAGTKDLTGYIAAGSSNTEIVLTTLPHRHDLDPTHPVHYQTVLVNAYIEELAARHNIRVFHETRPTSFLARQTVTGWDDRGSDEPSHSRTRDVGAAANHRNTAATTPNIPTPAAARGESATTRQRPASIQNVTYADAVRRSPSPDILQSKGCSENLKENSVFLGSPFYSKGLN
ncbi:hypothetical protein J6590_006576 [Homalodisca vitripennis]|nr:hypothetical protein J6590_006576 [Homalodisca vitripennis]